VLLISPRRECPIRASIRRIVNKSVTRCAPPLHTCSFPSCKRCKLALLALGCAIASAAAIVFQEFGRSRREWYAGQSRSTKEPPRQSEALGMRKYQHLGKFTGKLGWAENDRVNLCQFGQPWFESLPERLELSLVCGCRWSVSVWPPPRR
jgi:hypothetical protein